MSARKRPASKPNKPAETIEWWLVYRLGGARAAYLGNVRAADQEAALAAAFAEFDINTAAERRRIVVRATGHA